MPTIICISTPTLWQQAQKDGSYTNSTIYSTLGEVGFIHATEPHQTIEISQRFKNEPSVILLFIDADKVAAPVKFEPTKSGRPGLFPHIYGPLNLDAVYKIVPLQRNADNDFTAPDELVAIQES